MSDSGEGNFQRFLIIGLFTAFFFVFLQGTSKAQMFDSNVTVGASTVNQTFRSVEDLVNSITNGNLQAQFPAYTPVTPVTGTLNYRGLPINFNYAAGAPALTISIPEIGLTGQTFTGATRDDSNKQFQDWLKRDGAAWLTKIYKYLISRTATDPLAGNPNSLAGQMVYNAFERGFMNKVSQMQPSLAGQTRPDKNADIIGIGARYGNFKQNGHRLQTYTLPLSYTIRGDNDARKQFTVSLPLQLMDAEGSLSYNGGLGAAYSIPITDQLSHHQWILTPSIDYGAIGSVDMGAAGQIVQGALTSLYTTWIDKYTVSMGNMIAHYKTLKFSIAGYSIDPDISNTVFRNGIMLSIPTDSWMSGTVMEVFAIDTRLAGSDVKVKAYNEFGFAFGLVKSKKLTYATKAADAATGQKGDIITRVKNAYSSFKLSVSYLTSSSSKGFMVNFGYLF